MFALFDFQNVSLYAHRFASLLTGTCHAVVYAGDSQQECQINIQRSCFKYMLTDLIIVIHYNILSREFNLGKLSGKEGAGME